MTPSMMTFDTDCDPYSITDCSTISRVSNSKLSIGSTGLANPCFISPRDSYKISTSAEGTVIRIQTPEISAFGSLIRALERIHIYVYAKDVWNVRLGFQ